jgi:16S rRNA (cytidine1402-2'-O)-methyltransferase
MSGTLYIVGGPIGNKKDASPFFIESIQKAKYLVVEQIDILFDQLKKFNAPNPTGELIPIEYVSLAGEPGKSLELENLDKIINILKNGEDVYLVSDEGMPGIADPGELLIREAIKNDINIYATPGPSVVLSAVAIAGCLHKFSFEGFLSFDSWDRGHEWKELKNRVNPMVFLIKNRERNVIPDLPGPYSDHIFELMEEAMETFGENRKAVLMYNLTSEDYGHPQSVFRGTLKYLYDFVKNNERLPGNCCIVIDGKISKII